jgi:hypothetical protein
MDAQGIRIRPAALADAPGEPGRSFTRAVVQYRPFHEIEGRPADREDIGLGVVINGDIPLAADVVDLGSGRLRLLDLGLVVVVLDWVTEDTCVELRRLLAERLERDGASGLLDFCRTVAFEVLSRAGYNALTRTTFLRVAFRDLLRDLDLHEGATIRVRIGGGDVLRLSYDPDNHRLLASRRVAELAPELPGLLRMVFPAATVRTVEAGRCFELRFPLPLSLEELDAHSAEIRAGVLRLYEFYEPDRHSPLARLLDVLGPSHTIGQLALRGVGYGEPAREGWSAA